MNEGLYQKIDAQREAVTKARGIVADSETSPYDAHLAKGQIESGERSIERMEVEAVFGEEAADLIQRALGLMGNLTMTRHAQILITSLENATYRLRSHLGIRPQELTAEAASPSVDVLMFETFEACQNIRPHLLMEVGFNRVTDWMVIVWDATGCGIGNAPIIIQTQSPDRAEAVMQAIEQLRTKFPH